MVLLLGWPWVLVPLLAIVVAAVAVVAAAAVELIMGLRSLYRLCIVMRCRC